MKQNQPKPTQTKQKNPQPQLIKKEKQMKCRIQKFYTQDGEP